MSLLIPLLIMAPMLVNVWTCIVVLALNFTIDTVLHFLSRALVNSMVRNTARVRVAFEVTPCSALETTDFSSTSVFLTYPW